MLFGNVQKVLILTGYLSEGNNHDNDKFKKARVKLQLPNIIFASQGRDIKRMARAQFTPIPKSDRLGLSE